MFASGRITCFWPGLPEAWHRGNTRGLALAILTAWLLVLLLVASFVWKAWFTLTLLRAMWVVAISGWLWLSAKNHWQFKSLVFPTTNRQHEERFQSAQQSYLKGSWFEAEAELQKLIQADQSDAEALLMLIGVQRRTRRFKPALRRLEQLEKLDSAAIWQFEILRERTLILRLQQDSELQAAEPSAASPASNFESATHAENSASVNDGTHEFEAAA